MYFWNTNKLVKTLREDALSEKEVAKYLVGHAVCSWLYNMVMKYATFYGYSYSYRDTRIEAAELENTGRVDGDRHVTLDVEGDYTSSGKLDAAVNLTLEVPKGTVLRTGEINGIFGGQQGATQWEIVLDKAPTEWFTKRTGGFK